MTPKQALIKDATDRGVEPLCKEGKGRLSGAAKDRLAELVAAGWNIDGYKAAAPSTAHPAPKVERVKVPNAKEVVELAPLRYDENLWQAVAATPIFGTTVFGMREVCTPCGVSLVAHVCDKPQVLGTSVKILPKKS